MAEEFVRLGHTVFGCGRTEKIISELNDRFGLPHFFCPMDVTSDADMDAWAAGTIGPDGPPDLLINHAAVINRNAPLWKVSAEEFHQVIDTNIKGMANVIRHFVPAMVERGRGVILNFSSGWGHSTDAEVAPYCATQWAIEGLTQALAQELPSGVPAVALNPGIINTEMLQSCFGSSAASFPTATEWAKKAVPFILELGPQHHGRSFPVPS